jgi:hypothetical protein
MSGVGDVSVSADGDGSFRVEVRGPSATTTHRVTVSPGTVTALGWTGTEADLVRESFAFLLEREPHTSVLRSFDLEVIGSYFPEYPTHIAGRSSGKAEPPGQSS